MMKLNPKDMERAMRRMGMQTQSIEAEEVVIKTAEKDIVLLNPQVTKVSVMGQMTFQIMGEETERPREKFSEDDVRMVMQKAGVDHAAARKALSEEGDIASAILRLKK
jgi:nascent polypeptide-associated complex subunit alpha